MLLFLQEFLDLTQEMPPTPEVQTVPTLLTTRQFPLSGGDADSLPRYSVIINTNEKLE